MGTISLAQWTRRRFERRGICLAELRDTAAMTSIEYGKGKAGQVGQERLVEQTVLSTD